MLPIIRAEIDAAMTSLVLVADIKVDTTVQPRVDGINRDHLAALMASDELPPIILASRGVDLVLVEGFHRLVRSQNLGEEKVEAIVLHPPLDTDLRELAFELNRTHGLPLTLADRRAEADRLLRRAPETSDREIGRSCGLTQPTVAKVRRALEAGAEIEPAGTRVGRGGYTFAAPSRDKSAEAGEQAERRRLGVFLYRLSTTLERLWDHPAWTSTEEAALCLVETYEEDDALDIIDSLGRGATAVLELARACGFEPENQT